MRAMTLALVLALVGTVVAPTPPLATGASSGDADDAPLGLAAATLFDVDLEFSELGRFRRDGSAVVLGTISCSRRAEFAWVEVLLRQRTGRRFVFGWGSRELVPCRKRATDLKIEVAETDGIFRGGRVKLQSYVIACRRYDCVENGVEQVLRLKGR